MCNEIAPWLDCHESKLDDEITLGRVGGKGKAKAEPFPYSDCVCVYCLEVMAWSLYKAFQANIAELESRGDISRIAARRRNLTVIKLLWNDLYCEINDR